MTTVEEQTQTEEQTTNAYMLKLEELRKEKKRLEFMQITKPKNYANEWMALAREYKNIDAIANAAYCRNRADHYMRQA